MVAGERRLRGAGLRYRASNAVPPEELPPLGGPADPGVVPLPRLPLPLPVAGAIGGVAAPTVERGWTRSCPYCSRHAPSRL